MDWIGIGVSGKKWRKKEKKMVNMARLLSLHDLRLSLLPPSALPKFVKVWLCGVAVVEVEVAVAVAV